MIETFKIKNELSLAIMDSIFERRNQPYNLKFSRIFDKKKNCALWS